MPVPEGEARRWMRQALTLARRAAAEGEVPVGALVLRDGELLAEGWNRTESLGDPTAHAEILALRRAANVARNHRLVGATLVTTLEPCVMCFGAILESRVEGLVIGAQDPRRGGVELWNSGRLDRYPGRDLCIQEGVEEEECRGILQGYFGEKRNAPRAR